MRRKNLISCLLALFAVALVATACGNDGGEAEGTAPDVTEGSSEGDDEAERRGEGISFKIGFTGETDVGHLAMLEAMERMEEELGYETEAPYLAETELVTDSVIRGEFQFGIITTPVLVAYERGVTNLEIVGIRNPNDWAIVAQSDIESCDDLDGRTFAIHSEGSVMASIYREWASGACSEGVSANDIVISGSNNRTAALIAGQIDATAVQIQDLATLNKEYSGKFNVVSPQWQENPDLISSAVYVNAEWAAEHSQAVTDLLFYMTQVAREWAEDSGAFEAAIREALPELDDADIEFFIDELGAPALYATNGGITEEAMDDTIAFFTSAGTIEGKVTTEEILELSYLQAALDELDVELSTKSDFAD